MKKSLSEKIIKSRKNGYFFKVIWLVFLFLISVLLARYVLIGINDMLAAGRKSNIVQIQIPVGASLDDISSILKESGVIKEKEFFKLYSRVTKSSKKFYPGSYELTSNMDYQAILNHISNQSNSKDIIELTFTEGMNILEFADSLEEKGVCFKNEFIETCKSDNFDSEFTFLKDIKNSNKRIYKLEGYLFPDTYKFYRGENPQKVITKLLNNYNKKIVKKSAVEGYNEKISIKELAEQASVDIDKLTVIASLIQAEAADKEDMYKVSSVIHNRLNTIQNGGKNKFGEFALNILQIDATTYYPYRNKTLLPAGTSKSFKSSYDTYTLEGLPPGAICNPGIDAFLAALNPAQTDYYYYCHSVSGEAFYAKTLSEHSVNLKKAGL